MADKRLTTMAYDEILKAMDKQEIGLFDAWKELDKRKAELKDFEDYLGLQGQFEKIDGKKQIKEIEKIRNEQFNCAELSEKIAAIAFDDFVAGKLGKFRGTADFRSLEEAVLHLAIARDNETYARLAVGVKERINDCLAFLEELKKAL